MKWENEEAKAGSIKSRHETLQVFFVSLFVFATICSMVTGCTIYNVERLKTPIKQEHIDTYERGAKE